jgi:peptidase E
MNELVIHNTFQKLIKDIERNEKISINFIPFESVSFVDIDFDFAIERLFGALGCASIP